MIKRFCPCRISSHIYLAGHYWTRQSRHTIYLVTKSISMFGMIILPHIVSQMIMSILYPKQKYNWYDSEKDQHLRYDIRKFLITLVLLKEQSISDEPVSGAANARVSLIIWNNHIYLLMFLKLRWSGFYSHNLEIQIELNMRWWINPGYLQDVCEPWAWCGDIWELGLTSDKPGILVVSTSQSHSVLTIFT